MEPRHGLFIDLPRVEKKEHSTKAGWWQRKTEFVDRSERRGRSHSSPDPYGPAPLAQGNTQLACSIKKKPNLPGVCSQETSETEIREKLC